MLAGSLEIQLLANLARLQSDMDGARRIVTNATDSMGAAANVLKAALGGLAGALSVGALVAWTRGAIDAADSVSKISQKTAVAVKDIAGLQLAYQQAGVGSDVLVTSMGKLSKGIIDGSKDLQKLGINARNLDGTFKSNLTVLYEVADAFAKMEDSSAKTDLAMGLFTKTGIDLIPLLNGGAAGLRAMAAEAEALGLVISEQTAKDAEKFNDTLDSIGMASAGAATIFAAELLPALVEIAAAIREGIKSGAIREWAVGAANAIKALVDAIGPAIKIAAAYFAIFVAAPAILGAVGVAMTGLIAATSTYAMNVLIGQTASIGWNTALFGTSVAANLAAGSLTRMALVANVLFAAFAGWQIGTYLSDQFVEVRLAGLVMVATLLVGWEKFKYAAEMAGEGMRYGFNSAINLMSAVLGEFLSVAAEGFSLIGGKDLSQQLSVYADSLKRGAMEQRTFAQTTAGITAAHKAAVDAIDADIIAQMQYELSIAEVAKAEAAAVKPKGALATMTDAQKKAYEDAVKKAKDFIEALQRERAEIGKSASEIKMMAAARAAAAAPTALLRDTILSEAHALDAAALAWKGKVAAEKVTSDAWKALADTTKGIDDQVVSLKRQIEVYGLTEVAVVELAIAKSEAALAAGPSSYAELLALDEQIAKLKELLILTQKKSNLDETKKANEAMVADWTKTVDKYGDVFRTGFADMLNNGKEGWKSFTKSLVTTFKTSVADQLYKMFLQPFVMQIAANFAGSSGSAGGGAGGNAMQLVQTGKSIYSAFATAASSGGGLAGFGKSLYASFTSAASGSGAAGSAGASGASAGGAGAGGLYVAGWIAAGMALSSSLYKKGWDAQNGSLSSTGPIAPFNSPMIQLNRTLQGLGLNNGLSNMLSGASTVSRLFGRKNPEVENYGIEGSFGASGFDGNAYQNILEKGGVFRSDKRYQTDTALDAGTESTFDDTIKNLMLAVKGFGAQMGVEATAIDGYTKAINLTLTSDDAKNQELIAGVFGGIGDDLAKLLIPKIVELSLKGESAADALQRLATGYGLIDAALESIGRSFGAVGIDSLDARERLIELSGGLESFGKGAAYFAQNYLSEAERLEPIAASVNAALAGLGLSSVTTRDQFKDVVLGLDLTSESGATTYSELMKIQEAFALLHPIIDTTTEAINAAAEAARNERVALQEQLNALVLSPETLAGMARNSVSPDNLALYDQVQTAAATKAAIEGVNAANQSYIDQIREIERSYLTQAELRALDIVGMNESTIAWYDLLQARKAEKIANDEAKGAALAASQAQTDRVLADMNLRAAGTVASQTKATTEIIDLSKQRASMELALYNLTHSAAEQLARARQLELDGMDSTLRPLQNQIYAMQDQASAAALAATALENAAASARAIASERGGLQREMFQMTGNTAALRKLELEALDPSNRALKESIFSLQDKMAADQAAAAAAEQMAQAMAAAAAESRRAADELKKAWQGATDSIFDEVARIRGLTGSGSGAESLASAQARFTVTSAQARSGDQEAARLLPGLSQALLTLAESNAITTLDLRRIQAQTAASLMGTGSGLAAQFGLNVPSFDVGTNYVTSSGLAMIHEGEEIRPAGASRPFTADGGDTSALEEKVVSMTKAISRLETALDKIARDSNRVANIQQGIADGDIVIQTSEVVA